jgi:Mg-chelatase subunit ChlD
VTITDEEQTQTPTPTQPQDVTLFGSSLYSGVACTSNIAKFTCMASIRVPDDDKDEDDDIDEGDRAPVLVVAVVDKSGSMAGAKLKSLKETLLFIIKELGKKDKLAIVEYDTNVKTTLPVTLMNEAGKQQADSVVQALKSGSATNLSGGLMEGLRLIPNEIGNETVVSTLLLTDGLANHGIRTANGIVAMIRKAQSQGIGRCTVNTFGFGSDHDAAMLKEIAQAAEGMYYYIENEDSIASAFADCIGGLLSVRAQGVELEINTAPDIVLGEVFTCKPLTVVTEGRKVRIALGDLQNGEERDITFEVNLPSGNSTDSQSIANIQLSFFDMLKNDMRDLNCNLTIARPTEPTAEQSAPNLLVDRNCNRIKGSNALAEALKLGDKNQLAQAREILERVISEIKQSPSSGEEFCVTLLQELQTSLNGMQDRRQYQNFGKYQMNNMCHVMAEQRCASSASAPQAQMPSSYAGNRFSDDQQESLAFASLSAVPAPAPQPMMSKPMFATKNRARMKKKCAKR